MVTSAQAPAPAYLFRQHIVRTSRFLLHRLEAEVAEGTLKSDPRTYLHVLGYAARSQEAWPHVSRILVLLAPQMEQAGHRYDWMEQLRTGIDLSQQHDDAATEAELRTQLGHLQQLMGDYEDAKRQFDRSLLIFAGLGDHANRARVWYRLAAIYRSQRNYVEAQRLVLKALDTFAPGSADAAHGHFRLGTIYNDLGEHDQAIDQFMLVIDSRRQIGSDIRLQAWSHANIGFARMRERRFDEAQQHFFTALEYFDRIEDPVNEAVVTMNLGNIYYRLESYEEALACFEKARIVFQKTHELPRLAIVLNNVGVIMRKLQRYEQAVESHQLSVEISRRLGDKKRLANAISGLAAVAQAQGRHEEALAGFQQALVILEGIRDQFDVESLIEATRELWRISAEALNGDEDSAWVDTDHPH